MRHFAHHIGDYAAATAHLSFVEDAAYHRLLRLYYQNERPLPANENEVMRLVRAASRSEKNAVSRILREFFTLMSDGWHQSRADQEINVYKGQANRGRTNGIRGGRPSRNREGTATTNHEPITNKITRKRASKTQIDPDWKATPEQLDYAKGQGCADPPDTAERFKLYHTKEATAHKDWDAAWQYWCRNEKNFARPPNGKTAARTVTASDDPWQQRLRGYTPGGFWQESIWGPRPETGHCHAPKPILDVWRQGAA